MRAHSIVLCLAITFCASTQASVTNLYRVLRERGIPFDAGEVSARAVEAIVRTVDPWGRVLVEGAEIEHAAVAVDVSGERLPGNIGYVAVKGMSTGAGRRVGELLGEWIGDGLHGVILDVRGACGMDLESVDVIVGLVLGRTNELYTIKDGGSNVIERHCGAEVTALPRGFPVVVLVDGSTCGSAELLAAVLQREGGILVGGGRTRGDSGIRETFDLDDGRRLFIATRWMVPSGGNYAGRGVEPDIAVEDEVRDGGARREEALLLEGIHVSEGARLAAAMARRVAGDAVLKRAADIALGMRALYVSAPRSARSGDPP